MPSIGTAIGVGGSLLSGMGKKGGGGGSGQTSMPAYNLMPPQFREMIDKYLNTASGLSDRPYTPYTGQRIEPFSADENTAFQYARDNFGKSSEAINGANALNLQLQGRASEGPTMANLQPYMSPYQQAVIDQTKRETLRDFETNQIPGVGRAAGNVGAFGGSRQAILESEKYRNLDRNLTDIQERGSQAGYTNAQDAFFKTLDTSSNLAKTTAQTALLGQSAIGNDVNQMMQLGGAQRQLGQAGLDIGYNDFMEQQNYPINSLNILGGALGNMNPYFAPVSQPSSNSGSGGGSNLLGTLGSFANLAGMFFKEGGMVPGESKTQKLFAKGGFVKPENKYAGGSLINWDGGGTSTFNPTSTFRGSDFWSGNGSGGWMATLQSLLGGGSSDGGDGKQNVGTGALEKAFGQVAEDQLQLEKENRNTINDAGKTLSQHKFQPLIPAMLQSQTLSGDLVRQSHQALFSKGGPVNGYAGGGFIEKLRSMLDLNNDGLQARTPGIVPETTDETRVPIPRMSINQLPEVTGITDGVNPTLGSTNKTQEMAMKILNGHPATAQASSGGISEAGAMGGQPNRINIMEIMKELGLDQMGQQKQPTAKENPLLTAIQTLGGYGGSMVSPQVARARALSAGYGANNINNKAIDTTAKDAAKEKVQAIETAAKVQQLQNSQDWLNYQQVLMNSKMGVGGLDPLKLSKEQREQIKDAQRQVNDLYKNGVIDEDTYKTMYMNASKGALPTTTASPSVDNGTVPVYNPKTGKYE